jgi:transposase
MLYIGVDTHKKHHVLVALNDHGQRQAICTIMNTPDGWARALQWRRAWSEACCWGIENSGSLGKGFAQFLLEQGEEDVHEIVPHRTAQYRHWNPSQDKTDVADALAMARLLRAESAKLPRVRQDDVSTELRLLSDHRDNLVTERTRLINQLHDQMVQIDPSYKEKSGPLTRAAGIRYCAILESPQASQVMQTRIMIVHQLATQIQQLNEEIATITADLRRRVQATETPLLTLTGIGEIVAARLLGEIGSTSRLPSSAALAALSGTAPIAVSSGGRVRHRLNRGGNRQLNRAIHIMALGQRRGEPQAQAYYAKKRAEGKTERAALRCLKRRLVDLIYRTLKQEPSHPAGLTGAPEDVSSGMSGASAGTAA